MMKSIITKLAINIQTKFLSSISSFSKKMQALLLLWIFCILPVFANAVDTEELRIRYESMITERIMSTLATLLPDHTYSISSHINLTITSIESPKDRFTKKEKDEHEKFIPTPAPGFNTKSIHDLDIDKPKTKEVISENFTFDSKVEINKVEVFLIIDKKLEQIKKNLARTIVENRIKTNYGNKASLKVKESDFSDFNPPEENFLSDFIKNNLVHIMYFLLITAFFIVLLIIFKGSKYNKIIPNIEDKSAPKTFLPQMTSVNNDESSFNKKYLQISKYKIFDKILEIMKINERFVGLFIAQLQPDSKSAFISLAKSLENGGFLKPFFDSQMWENHLPEEISDEKIQHLSQSLDYFLKNQNYLASKIFGYLPLFTAKELCDAVGDDPKSLAIILSLIEQQQVESLLSLLPSELKAKTLHNLNKVGYLSEDKTSAIFLDKKLRDYLSNIRSIPNFSQDTQRETATRLLENDPTVESTIVELEKTFGSTLAPITKKYLIFFDDLIKEKNQKFIEVLFSFENAIIANALANCSEIEQKIVFAKCSDMRREIIFNIQKQLQITTQDISQAQRAIVSKYRKMIKD